MILVRVVAWTTFGAIAIAALVLGAVSMAKTKAEEGNESDIKDSIITLKQQMASAYVEITKTEQTLQNDAAELYSLNNTAVEASLEEQTQKIVSGTHGQITEQSVTGKNIHATASNQIYTFESPYTWSSGVTILDDTTLRANIPCLADITITVNYSPVTNDTVLLLLQPTNNGNAFPVAAVAGLALTPFTSITSQVTLQGQEINTNDGIELVYRTANGSAQNYTIYSIQFGLKCT